MVLVILVKVSSKVKFFSEVSKVNQSLNSMLWQSEDMTDKFVDKEGHIERQDKDFNILGHNCIVIWTNLLDFPQSYSKIFCTFIGQSTFLCLVMVSFA